jgi:hypothetical protein
MPRCFPRSCRTPAAGGRAELPHVFLAPLASD